MEETPREYKKRVDERWINNEKNRDKLIKKIDEYELLDKDYKTVTKQQILDNFSKNQKAEKESEQYITIVSELEEIDEKYKELEEIKENLKAKKIEKEKMESEIAETKWDGLDQTTLDLQMAALNEKNARYEALESEIKGIEKDIANREQEIQDIESTYGVKDDNNNEPAEEDSNTNEEPVKDSAVGIPSTLKEHYEQTIKDLWNKDKTVKEIYRLLDDGTGIDDKLKKKIKDDVSGKFLEYYDKNQGTLRMKSARFMKNRVGNSWKRFEEVKNLRKGSEREFKLQEIEREERIYGGEIGKVRELFYLSEKLDTELVEIKKCGEIAGKPVIKVKDRRGYYSIIWGHRQCGDNFFKEIGEIKEIQGKPCFKVKDLDGDCNVIWGHKQCVNGSFKEVGEIQKIGKELCFKLETWSGHFIVKWGEIPCGALYKEIGEIQNIGKKPCFTVGDRWAYWGHDLIGEGCPIVGDIKNIGHKPVLMEKNDDGHNRVYWGLEPCGGWYKEIGEIQDIGKKPCFKVKKEDGEYLTWGIYRSASGYKEIGEVFEVDPGEPAFMAEDKDGHWQTHVRQ